MPRLLLVEDDEGLASLLSELLQLEGFELERAADGEQGLALAQQQVFDLIILDIMLPKKNGFDLLRELRQQRATPVIMLTARGEEVDRIVGLEIGADDYLPKPCSPRELLARIRALLRRVELERQHSTHSSPVAEELVNGRLQLNLRARQALLDGQPLPLTGTEFSLLEVLSQHPGELLSREFLSKEVLHKRLQPFDRSLDMHVSNLRRKLGEGEGLPKIETMRGQGYLYLPEGELK
ncbi:response regulator [Balneatrix alpica]|uniref:response regulator n=1 Tax=Balneatrix alpica TaxID=75684 RepID=UPI00273946FF|nr:response regulator [Balneatrix alpica]